MPKEMMKEFFRCLPNFCTRCGAWHDDGTIELCMDCLDAEDENVGKWYEDDQIGGVIREDGTINVLVEKNVSDADTGAHFVEVQNGEGYYDSEGRYRRYARGD